MISPQTGQLQAIYKNIIDTYDLLPTAKIRLVCGTVCNDVRNA
ncbi:MAG: hypothetical protein ACI9X0_000459 [Kiritimatiellia bacterium]|jgi:hypothetical protein